MINHPIVQDLIKYAGLNETQAAGAVGLVLGQLRKYVQPGDFATLLKFIPDAEALIKQAPEIKSGLLGGLANSLGGDKAKALLDINIGLSQLGIPTSKQKELADTLKNSVAKHYPDLVSLIDLA
jgi:hypothetical protein